MASPDAWDTAISERAAQAWDDLPTVWQRVFEQAWTSWTEGNLGIGAALHNPRTDEVVSIGRNQIRQPSTEVGVIGGNLMAHAEMNALATLARPKADGLHLYTTLEPCLMCAAAAVFMHVDVVHYAATDEFFADVDELWTRHPYANRWKPDRTGPLGGPLAALARLLPLTQAAVRFPDGHVMDAARQHTPQVAQLATELASDPILSNVAAQGGRVVDALEALWPRLPG